jgi:hypothetical protein
MPVTGVVWVDPVDGVVLRTNMEIAVEVRYRMPNPKMDPSVVSLTGPGYEQETRSSARVLVSYGRDARLGLLVPVEMRESYDGLDHHRIECRATYSQFKRFETAGRVIIPK